MNNKKLMIAAIIIVVIIIAVAIYFFNKGTPTSPTSFNIDKFKLGLQSVLNIRDQLIAKNDELRSCASDLEAIIEQIKRTYGETLTIDGNTNALKESVDQNMANAMSLYDELLASIVPDLKKQIDKILINEYPTPPTFPFTPENIYEVFNAYNVYMNKVVKALSTLLDQLQNYISQVETQINDCTLFIQRAREILKAVEAGKKASQEEYDFTVARDREVKNNIGGFARNYNSFVLRLNNVVLPTEIFTQLIESAAGLGPEASLEFTNALEQFYNRFEPLPEYIFPVVKPGTTFPPTWPPEYPVIQ